MPVRKQPVIVIVLAALMLVGLLSMIGVGSRTSYAQTVAATATVRPIATTTPAATVLGPSNDATAFIVLCDAQAVVNLTGTTLIGWDVYYQVFNAANLTGTALTGVRQVSTAGTFTFSETVAYTAGSTLGAGTTGSARVWVGRETNSSTVDYEFTVNDVNDGCAEPQNTIGVSADAGSAISTTGTTTTAGVLGFTRSIFAPTGLLNPNLQPEAEVVIGARPSDTFRSSTPGIIFAECDAFPLAQPGIIYDSDRVLIYWSWFTRTRAQMDQHLAAVQYNVTFNTANLPGVNRSDIQRRDGSANQWVFYSVDVGNLRPGHYEVSYNVTWSQPVNDGYDDYGPGTANPVLRGLCNFDITQNPNGTSVVYNGSYFPSIGPVHDINPDY